MKKVTKKKANELLKLVKLVDINGGIELDMTEYIKALQECSGRTKDEIMASLFEEFSKTPYEVTFNGKRSIPD